VWIRLKGDLGSRLKPPQIPCPAKNPAKVSGRNEGWGSATKKYGAHLALPGTGALQHLGGKIEFTYQLIGVLCPARTRQLTGGVGVEIAVAAAYRAKRNVQVETEFALL